MTTELEAPAGGDTVAAVTTTAGRDVALPAGVVKRVVKAKLAELSAGDKDFALNKDAVTALAESAKVFISYITSTANDICKEKKRQTIGVEDVFSALEDCDFTEMVAPLREALQGALSMLIMQACVLLKCVAHTLSTVQPSPINTRWNEAAGSAGHLWRISNDRVQRAHPAWLPLHCNIASAATHSFSFQLGNHYGTANRAPQQAPCLAT